MASKFQFITELYSRTLTKLTGDYESWTGFLRAACYNYKCPFDEQVLIYAQRPNATAVLELEKWNKQFGRWVNTGATGIAVIDETYGKGRLKHYFDITDTHTTPVSRPVPIWTMEPAYTERVIETLEATFGTLAEKDTLPDAILSASRNAVADNVQDYLRDLLDCREGSMLEELDALNVEVTYRRALESSVAYMLMTRLSLPAMAYLLPEDFEGVYSFDTPGTINALGIVTSDIAEMGLREISRTVMQARREQFFAKDAQIGYDAAKEQNNAEKERSAEHGSDLQSAGGLSPAEPVDAARAGDASGQVRGAAETVSDAAPPSAVYQPQDQRPTDGASGGDRGDSAEDGDAGRGADGEGRGRDGGTEGHRSPALDGPDEQPEAQRGGNGAERPDLQLISEEPAEAGSDALPALADDRANLYHVAAYHHFENGFDDKLDYPTLEEAEAAAQGYVSGTMEADGFAYDGAAVYDASTGACLRIYLIVDPKGEMLRSTGYLLKEEGYDIKVFDLIHPRQSDGYNPFTYIRDDPDVLKLMDNLVKNTTPPKGASNDPFWEKAEIALDSALMLYLLYEAPVEEQNFEMLMFMLECARVMEEDEQYQSPLDLLFQTLEERDPSHIAVREYKVYKQAAGKTAKSILVTASVRLAAFIFPQYAAMMQTDEMDFASMGERKRAIFCVIPVNDGSMNYLVSMLLTQCFQQLYLRADERYNGRLPMPVRVIQDEWANVAQPDSYPKVLATCRSYNIGINIIVQNIQSIKALYKDEWEGIIGNCDTLLFLGGGNEPTSLEFVSKLLGKETVHTRTRGQTKGRSGSSSVNYQQTGRDLMTPDEIRMLPTKDALLFIRGEKPVRDKKYDIKKHPNVRRTADGEAKPYIHNPLPVPDYSLPDLPYEFRTLDDYTFLEDEHEESKNNYKERLRGCIDRLVRYYHRLCHRR